MKPAFFFARTTSPMEPPPTPSPAERTTEPAPVSSVVNRVSRPTEPLSVVPRRAVLPFRPVVPVQGLRAPEPPEEAPTRSALVPAEAAPDSLRLKKERDAVRAFCFVVLGTLLLGNGALWLVLALRPAPPPAPVVEPSLPAAFLGALASSSSTRPPEPSTAPASSSAPSAASASVERSTRP